VGDSGDSGDTGDSGVMVLLLSPEEDDVGDVGV